MYQWAIANNSRVLFSCVWFIMPHFVMRILLYKLYRGLILVRSREDVGRACQSCSHQAPQDVSRRPSLEQA